MDELLANPAFTTYATCTAILVIKCLFSAAHTATARIRSKHYVNPEDAAFLKGQTVERDDPSVARILRIQRNDVENLPPFFAIGLVFVLVGASPFAATAYFWTFTVARILHTFTYATSLQPFRTLFFFVGVSCLLGMAVQVLMVAL